MPPTASVWKHRLLQALDAPPRAAGPWRVLGTALLALAVAVLVRREFLAALEGRIVWVTFYPALMVAAIAAGFWSGVLVAAGACVLAVWGWPLLGAWTFIDNPADLYGLWVFLFNGVLMSLVAESSRWARRQAWNAKVRAETADRAKTVFLASMSHEIRTPLNAILGFSRLLGADPGLSPDGRRQVATIRRSGDHLLGLIDEILDHARLEAGKVATRPVAFDLPSLLGDLAEIFGRWAEEKGLAFDLQVADGMGRLFRGDVGKLRQILFNVLGNAVKFTDRGGVRMEVESPSPGRIRVVVEDTGIGIAASDRESVFEPFRRAEASETTHRGTGLGLALARAYARLLGGDLRLVDRPGPGSRFEVEVHLEPLAGTGMEHSGTESTWRLAPGSDPGPVLVVDDHADNRELMRDLLGAAGFEVRLAASGEEALRMLESQPAGIVLTDLLMPGMDGNEFVRRLRRLPGKRKVVVGISASAWSEDRSSFLAAGGDACLSKPVDPTDLFDHLERLTGLALVRTIESREPSLPDLDLDAIPPEWAPVFRQALDRGDLRAVEATLSSLPTSCSDIESWIRVRTRTYDLSALQRLARALPARSLS